jgi:hypothetical protein
MTTIHQIVQTEAKNLIMIPGIEPFIFHGAIVLFYVFSEVALVVVAAEAGGAFAFFFAGEGVLDFLELEFAGAGGEEVEV